MLGLRESDLVAARMPAGAAWLDLIAEVRDARATLLPLDDRLPDEAMRALLARTQPTLTWDGATASRIAGEPCAPGLVIATSGSSGQPRAVCLAWEALDAAVRASVVRLGATGADAWLSCLPLSHMGGLLVLLRAMALDAPLRFGPFTPGVAFASIVPTQLARAVDDGVDLSTFTALIVGGAALDDALATRGPVVRTYGLTESAGGVIYDGVPLDGVSVRIGEDDEIQLAGPTLMSGYRLDEAATARAFTADGWLRTRDAGAIAEGRLIVHGRLDDVINTGAEKVWPSMVERVLRAHPRVAEVAVFGRPDPEWGERVVACVEPHGDPPTLDELRAFARDRLAAYALPREVITFEQLPRTALGKIARARLRQR